MNVFNFFDAAAASAVRPRWLLWVALLAHAVPVSAELPIPASPAKTTQRAAPPSVRPCVGFPIPVVESLPVVQTPLRVAYINAWTVASELRQKQLLSFVQKSEINALVIDVKDCSGCVSFETEDPEIERLRIEPAPCKNLKAFVDLLHQKGVYVIARMVAFQDPAYAKHHPTEAIQSQKGGIWLDYRGFPYIDPASKRFWGYIARLAKACKTVGFDEINFDYLRFPTDGRLKEMVFPHAASIMKKWPQKQWVYFYNPADRPNGTDPAAVAQQQERCVQVEITPKATLITHFYQFLYEEVRKKLDMPISADLFGMVLTARTDLNIGQVLEMALPYFDYIGPMIYPSHYPKGFRNLVQPAAQPYEVVVHVLQEGVRRLQAIGQSPHKLRPWLQDFHLGARYEADKVQAQKKGVYDAGLHSWFVWNPSSRYALEKYLPAAPKP